MQYVWDASTQAWRHLPNQALHYSENSSVTIRQPDKLAPRNVTYLVYLPLRNAPAQMQLQVVGPHGICGGRGCAADTAPAFATPAVAWYGTSIQQGGVASRAGTAYDAIIARALRREVD